MTKSPLQKNILYTLSQIVSGFFVSIYASSELFFRSFLGKTPTPIKENPFLDALNFCLHIGPKHFWKAPSGIKIGRSVSSFLHYILRKDEHFTTKSKK